MPHTLWALLLMATIIGTTILGTLANGTGYAFQPHLFWAANDAAWWLVYTASTDATHVLTYRSPDGTTWAAKSGYASTQSDPVNADGRNLCVAYKGIASADVFHVAVSSVSANAVHHNRGTASGAAITWGVDARTTAVSNQASPTGDSCAFSGDSHVYDSCNQSGDVSALKSSNADSGTSWTAGFGGATAIDTSISQTSFGSCLVPCDGTTKMLILEDNGSNAAAGTSMTNVLAKTWNGTTITPAAGTAGVGVFTAFTARNTNSFGVARVDDTHVHVVCQTGGNTFVHKIVNGNGAGNPTVSGGATIPNQTSKAGAGVALVTDGVGNLYAFIIDTDSANTVRYIKYNGTSWGATWTALETSTQVRNFINASPTLDASGNIGVVWAQANGSNFDVAFTTLATASGGTASQLFEPAWYQEGRTRFLTPGIFQMAKRVYSFGLPPLKPEWRDWRKKKRRNKYVPLGVG